LDASARISRGRPGSLVQEPLTNKSAALALGARDGELALKGLPPLSPQA
jgi:hypothetical protein